MKNLMHYKDYYGSVEFDPDEMLLYGKLEFVKALISYEGKDVKSVKRAFETAVDDYLEHCKAHKRQPETPFKGSFNIRTGNELHRKIALAANKEKLSINRFICQVLESVCEAKLSHS